MITPIKLLNNKLIYTALIGILVALHLFIFYKIKLIDLLSGQTPMLDFDAYWHLARAVITGLSPYQVNTMQTAGPPLVILPFLPFGFLPIQWGRAIITILNLTATSISCYLLAKKIAPSYQLLAASLLSFILWLSFPARFSLSLGQQNLIIVLLITIALIDQNDKIKGFILALLIIFKSFFLFSIFSLFKEAKKTIFWSLLFGAFILLLSLQLIKPIFYQEFITQRLGSTMLQAQPIKDVDYYNQSIKTTMARFDLGQFYTVSYIFITVLSIIYLLKTGNLQNGIIISTLLSPFIWQHYFVYFFPIFILVGHEIVKAKKWKWLIFWFLALGFWLWEFPWLQNQPTTLFNSIVASHYLISALILLFLVGNMNNHPVTKQGLNLLSDKS